MGIGVATEVVNHINLDFVLTRVQEYIVHTLSTKPTRYVDTLPSFVSRIHRRRHHRCNPIPNPCLIQMKHRTQTKTTRANSRAKLPIVLFMIT